MLKSSKEEILEFYTDLFPKCLSQEDIEYYFDDCVDMDDESRRILEDKLEYIVDKLRFSGKWISA